MKIQMSGAMAHLEGDWTIAGVEQTDIHSLALTLQQIESGGARSLEVDCRQISAIDATGLQLRYVWMQCARLRGFEPELVNVPDNLRQSVER